MWFFLFIELYGKFLVNCVNSLYSRLNILVYFNIYILWYNVDNVWDG